LKDFETLSISSAKDSLHWMNQKL